MKRVPRPKHLNKNADLAVNRVDAYLKNLHAQIPQLFASGLNYEQIAEKLSTPEYPLTAATVKMYLSTEANRRSVSRETFEALLRRKQKPPLATQKIQ